MGLSAIVEPGCALLLEALQSGVVAEELPVGRGRCFAE